MVKTYFFQLNYRFYPHHYAPYMSDVKDFKDMDIKFDLAKPFLPFEQLMAVLPALSRDLLPQAFQVWDETNLWKTWIV